MSKKYHVSVSVIRHALRRAGIKPSGYRINKSRINLFTSSDSKKLKKILDSRLAYGGKRGNRGRKKIQLNDEEIATRHPECLMYFDCLDKAARKNDGFGCEDCKKFQIDKRWAL